MQTEAAIAVASAPTEAGQAFASTSSPLTKVANQARFQGGKGCHSARAREFPVEPHVVVAQDVCKADHPQTHRAVATEAASLPEEAREGYAHMRRNIPLPQRVTAVQMSHRAGYTGIVAAEAALAPEEDLLRPVAAVQKSHRAGYTTEGGREGLASLGTITAPISRHSTPSLQAPSSLIKQPSLEDLFTALGDCPCRRADDISSMDSSDCPPAVADSVTPSSFDDELELKPAPGSFGIVWHRHHLPTHARRLL